MGGGDVLKVPALQVGRRRRSGAVWGEDGGRRLVVDDDGVLEAVRAEEVLALPKLGGRLGVGGRRQGRGRGGAVVGGGRVRVGRWRRGGRNCSRGRGDGGRSREEAVVVMGEVLSSG